MARVDQFWTDATETDVPWNVIRVNARCDSTSLLLYPDFYSLAHPQLHLALKVNVASGTSSVRRYRHHDTRPVLHRKETLIAESDPWHKTFAGLTQREECLGLLSETRRIGSQRIWNALGRDNPQLSVPRR